MRGSWRRRSSWYRRANIHNESLAGQPVIDDLPGQGAVLTTEVVEAADAGELAARRRLEDETYAAFAEASIVWLDLPDAVYRGYEGDDQLLGPIREDDQAPYDLLRQEILRLEPQMVYFPLGVGDHVDHQLCREVGYGLLGEARRWVMPGPDYTGAVAFYEDFPYAWWHDFSDPGELIGDVRLPRGTALEPRYSDITEMIERKAAGLRLYASQITRLFESDQGMLDDLWGYHTRVALAGGIEGMAERYWSAVRS